MDPAFRAGVRTRFSDDLLWLPYVTAEYVAATGDVEPYVIAADIYSQPPHSGRGGWSWYTGSSGWMYHFGATRYIVNVENPDGINRASAKFFWMEILCSTN